MEKKIISIILGLLVGCSIFAAPNIKGQSKIIKENAPKSAYVKGDENITFLATELTGDVYEVKLQNGTTLTYVAFETDYIEFLESGIRSWGIPKYAVGNNTELDKSLQKLTKLYGNTLTIIQTISPETNKVLEKAYIWNSYDAETGTFQFYEWYTKF